MFYRKILGVKEDLIQKVMRRGEELPEDEGMIDRARYIAV
jgi:hypothetical protein